MTIYTRSQKQNHLKNEEMKKIVKMKEEIDKIDKTEKQIDNVEEESFTNIELEVSIDFDEASREWRKNKKNIGNGQFKYLKWKLSTSD